MKYLFILFITLLTCITAHSQDQLRLRLGYGLSLNSGKPAEFHRAGGNKRALPSFIGLEYFKPLSQRKAGLLAGAFLEAQAYSGSIRYEKFPYSPRTYYAISDYGNIKLYIGYEKILTKNKRPNANYFSVFGGVGLSINNITGEGQIGTGGAKEMGTTLDGDIYGSVYWDNNGWGTPGYHSLIGIKTANRFGPDVFAGMRWNIRNRHADPIFIVEMVVNYGLIPKTYIEFPYTLNGEKRVDRVKDHGFNVQLNVLTPLKTFGKKKK